MDLMVEGEAEDPLMWSTLSDATGRLGLGVEKKGPTGERMTKRVQQVEGATPNEARVPILKDAILQFQ